MLKELKYLFFLIFICLIFFLSLKYYISDSNKRNTYRSLKLVDEKIFQYSQKLILLENNTSDIVEYVEKTIDKNKKDYNFWKLINNDE